MTNFISRAEFDAIQKATSEKLEAIFQMLKGQGAKIDKIMAWQNQFQGGLKLMVFLISSAGVLAGIIYGALNIFKHGGK